MSFAVVRVRGTVNINHEIRETLRYLNLTRINHCVVIPENPVMKGMLQKAKDYITWGEVSGDVLERMMKERGQLEGGHPLTDEYVKKNTDFAGMKELAKAIAGNKAEYKVLPGITPIFRLSPPKSGHRTVKRSFPIGGSLGYRGAEIDALLNRMI
jgi:large subunit ribosomal protein L30